MGHYFLCVQAVRDALADYFTKKKSRLNLNMLKALLRSTAMSSGHLLEALLQHHQQARNEFLKNEALQLIQVVLQPAKVSPEYTIDISTSIEAQQLYSFWPALHCTEAGSVCQNWKCVFQRLTRHEVLQWCKAPWSLFPPQCFSFLGLRPLVL